MAKRILFIVPYPLHESPSQRFRFEQYFGLLKSKGYSYTIQSFLNINSWRLFYSKGRNFAKFKAIALGLAKRIIAIAKSPMYDFIFIHREVVPFGPPIFEWMLAKILRRRIIYDFDDAIWLTDRPHESHFLKTLKWRKKVGSICRWAHRVSCGNAYLCDYAARFSKKVIYNPTTIDTENLHNRSLYEIDQVSREKIRIGWTGSHSTLKYLEEIASVIQKILQDYHRVEFVVIADKAPALTDFSDFIFVPWDRTTEIQDLLQFDIGVMPLPDDQWAKGKCGFKALQYMALEIPAVASPVGVNITIIANNVNGFLCRTPAEWDQTLRQLIEDSGLRKSIGIKGRRTVLENYSVSSNATNFLSLFE